MPPSIVWCLAGCLVLCGCGGRGTTQVPQPTAGGTTSSPAAANPVGGLEIAQPAKAAGVKYVPHVSEKKLREFLNGLDTASQDAVTQEQVFAIMGEPTRRDPPIMGKKNGQPFTVFEAHWEEPGSGLKSSIGFVNGRLGGGGMVLGLEVPKR